MQLTNKTRSVYLPLALLILLFAFAVRLLNLVNTPYDYDRSYPTGVGIALVDSLGSGDFGRFALHGQSSSLGWPNPILGNYIFALIALFNRNPFITTALTAVSSVLVVAISFDIGRRTSGSLGGLAGALLAASSPWAVFFSRGASQLCLFELSIALPAWLIFRGIVRSSLKQTIAGMLVAALSMHIYVVGFGLIIQVAVQSSLLMWHRPGWRKLCLAGLAVVVLSAATYIAVLLNADPQFLSHPYLRIGFIANPVERSPIPAFPINPLAVLRAFFQVGGSGFIPNFFRDSIQVYSGLDLLLNLRTLICGAAMILGMFVTLFRPSRLRYAILVWFWLPVVLMTLVTSISRETPVNFQYLFLTTPAGYVLGGIGLERAFRWIISHTNSITALPTYAIGTAVGGILLAGAVLPQQALDTTYTAIAARTDVLLLPMREQLRLVHAVQLSCDELSVPYNPFENRQNLEFWAMGMTGSMYRVHPTSEAYLGASQVWATRSIGGTCSVRPTNAPAPPGAVVIAVPDVNAVLYRSLPTTPHTPIALTNFGWALVDTELPPTLYPGKPMELRFTWRIDKIPDETYIDWRYDLFVKLMDDNGKTVSQGDVASIPGNAWRLNDQVVQTLVIAAPDRVLKGRYYLQLDLYDRGRGRNAVFIAANTLAQIGISLVLPLTSTSGTAQ